MLQMVQVLQLLQAPTQLPLHLHLELLQLCLPQQQVCTTACASKGATCTLLTAVTPQFMHEASVPLPAL